MSSPRTLQRRASTQAVSCGIGLVSRTRQRLLLDDAHDTRWLSRHRTADAIDNGRRRVRQHGQNEQGLALTRKNFLFAGSDAGGERAAIAYTILACCRLADVNPVEYLRDVLPRLARRVRLRDLPDLLPSRWKAAREAAVAAKASQAPATSEPAQAAAG